MLIRMSVGTATVKTVWRFLSKLKIELTYAAISLLCVYPLKKEMLVWKDICTPPPSHCSIIYNNQGREMTCVHQWMKGERSDTFWAVSLDIFSSLLILSWAVLNLKTFSLNIFFLIFGHLIFFSMSFKYPYVPHLSPFTPLQFIQFLWRNPGCLIYSFPPCGFWWLQTYGAIQRVPLSSAFSENWQLKPLSGSLRLNAFKPVRSIIFS